MSLINDALKKAQRIRTEEPAGELPPMPGGGGARIAKRAQPQNANTMVLIVSGAIVLVVLSVIATVVLLNRPARPKPAANVTSVTTKTAVSETTTGPAIVPPIIAPPPAPAPIETTAAATAPASTPAEKSGPSAGTDPKPASAAQSPATTPASAPATLAVSTKPEPSAPPPLPTNPGGATPSTVPASTTPTPVAPPPVMKPDDRVAAFVEAVRVTGIRSSGPEGRVLMNDRVYRVNDIVDRTLGVRLVKVAVDSLTFADANGLTYVKHF